jgi:lipopolysaccharide/colanic/teichoic acid biosynthesis glycosyltransferase
MRVPSPSSRSGSRIYLSLWDVIWALASPILALYLRDASIFIQADWRVAAYYCLLSSGFTLLAFFAFRLQDGMTRYFSAHELLDIVEAVLFAQFMTGGVLFTLTRLDGIPRSTPLINGLLLAAGIIAARVYARAMLSRGNESPDSYSRRERIILIGANRFASSFIQLLGAYLPQQQPVIAVLDDDVAMIGRAIAGVPVIGGPHQLDAIISEYVIHGINTDRIVIAGEADFLRPAVLHEIEHFCKKRGIKLSFLPRMIGVTAGEQPSNVAVTIEATPDQPSLAMPAYFRLKRWFDVVGSLLIVALFLPLLMMASVLVLLDVGVPILFWQERLGWKGRSFLIYKFRTLGVPFDAKGKPSCAGRQPSAIGRFLRATRIDELPQLINVLLGDMSLIGPRPLLPEDQPAKASIRLSVRPGITGWAQVNGGKLVTKEEKEKLDEYYIRNASLSMDFWILLATLRVMLKIHIRSQETLADTEQVQKRNIGLEPTAASSRVPQSKTVCWGNQNACQRSLDQASEGIECDRMARAKLVN